MVKFKKIISITLIIISTFILSSCANTPTVDVVVTAQRTAIKLGVTLSDPAEKLVDGRLYANIYEDTDDDNNYKEEDSLNTMDLKVTTYKEQSITFEDLDIETKYYIVIFGNYGSKKELYSSYVTTTNIGTEENPASIQTFEELMSISDYETGYYVLANDIDCTDETVTPIFGSANPFLGSFDGAGYTLKNIVLSTTGTYTGLFGYNSGTIKNLNIDGITLTSSRASTSYVGLLCGYNTGILDNIHIDNGTLSATSNGSGRQYVGGLVGFNDEGTTSAGNKINNCSVENLNMTVSARNISSIGGIAGENLCKTAERRPEISATFVTGTINVEILSNSLTSDLFIEHVIGGFIGRTFGKITDSYADVDISVETSNLASDPTDYSIYVGGFAGEVGIANWSKLVGCAAQGVISVIALDNVDSTDILKLYVGGFAGYQGGSGMILNSIFVVKNSSITLNATTEMISSYASSVIGYISDASKLNNNTVTETYNPVIIAGNFTNNQATVCVDYTLLEGIVLAFVNANK